MSPFNHFYKSRLISILLLLSLSSSELGFPRRVSSTVGINYGQLGDDLPPPDKVLSLLASLEITKARIYDTNPKILTAFANSGVELIVTIPNDMVSLLTNPEIALQWVATHIQPYLPATNITGIAVGNEVDTSADPALMGNLVPAMVAIHGALVRLGGLDSSIHVSTASSLAVLQTSYPPSAGCFRPELAAVMSPFLQFLATTGSPFWINAYPYFAYKDDPNRVPLDYVLFNNNNNNHPSKYSASSTAGGMVDPYTGLHYDNMLYAQVDAVISAMSKMGFNGIQVRVSETGWPSKGDPNEIGATMENARAYNRNLMVRQMGSGEGTPLMRPVGQGLEVYLFALFNEDMKPGPTSERNYGLFWPDGTMVYNVGLSSYATKSGSSFVSLTSSAVTRASDWEITSSWYWIFLFLLTSQALMTRESYGS